MKKITEAAFVRRAICGLRSPKHKGIHVVYSGFNEAFRAYYDKEPAPVIDRLVAEGVLEKRLVRGGILIFLAGEAPENTSQLAATALEKILPANYRRR